MSESSEMIDGWHIEKEVYDGLLIATVITSRKKIVAGLRELAKGQYQNYPPGLLELGIVIDALDMLVADVINCILVNKDDKEGKDASNQCENRMGPTR